MERKGKENDWYVSGEVDVYGYSGRDDTIYINNNSEILKRIEVLVAYAKIHDYTLEDIYKEYESLIRVFGENKENE